VVRLICVSPLPFSPSLCNPCFFSLSPGSVSPSLPPASPARRPLFFSCPLSLVPSLFVCIFFSLSLGVVRP
jgi:hypothetical protein